MNESRDLDIAATARMAGAEARRDRSREQASAKADPKQKKSKVVLGVSLVALLATSALNLLGANPLAIEIPEQTPAQEEQSRQEALSIQHDWVEGYRAETGHLPVEESEHLGPWSFVNLDGEDYKVAMDFGDAVLVFSSTDSEHRVVAEEEGVFE